MSFGKTSPWTVPVVEHFKALLAMRPALSYADVAHRLNRAHSVSLTKNACIGRARRLGFLRNGPKAKPRSRIAPMRLSRRLKQDAPTPQPPTPFTTRIEQLRSNSCRWPHGERPPYLYCGMPSIESCPYCLEHARISYPAMRRPDGHP